MNKKEEKKGISGWLWRRRMLAIQNFAEANRDRIVIVADPKDDMMYVAYRGRQVVGKIKSADGKRHHVVRDVLKASTFEREVPRFIGGILDVLRSPIEGTKSSFWHFIDAALFHISGASKLRDSETNQPHAEKEGAGSTGE